MINYCKLKRAEEFFLAAQNWLLCFDKNSFHCRYVGRTSLRLQERSTQNISKSIRSKEKPTKVLSTRNCKDSSTSIGMWLGHWASLISKPDCAAHYHERQFSILAKVRTRSHLAALEAIFIKTQQPILSRQKEFFSSL